MFKRAYVEITNVCNLHCSFCPGTARPRRFMSPEEFRIIARKLKAVTDYLYLHVMGEPLLHPQLPELLDIGAELGFHVCLTTNGTRLGQRQAELLDAPPLHKVSVSLHSFEGNHGGDMTDYLETVWNFVRQASRRGTICALRLWNGGGENTRNDEIQRFLSQKSGKEIEKLPLAPNGSRRLDEKLYLETADKFDWPDPEAPEQPTEFCYGLRQQLAVLCDGTVVPCCLDGEGRIALGNLLTQEPEEILSSPRAQAICQGFARRQPTEDLCRRCGYAVRFTK